MSVFSSPFNEPFHNPFGSPFNGPGVGGGAAPFDPAELGARLAFWYASNDPATLGQTSSGVSAVAALDPLGYIGDKSGNARHLTQATSAKRIKLNVDGEGRPYFYFDGTKDISLDSASFDLSAHTKLTVFFAGAPDALDGVYKIPFYRKPAGGDGAMAMMVNASTSTGVIIGSTGQGGAGGVPITTTVELYHAQYDFAQTKCIRRARVTKNGAEWPVVRSSGTEPQAAGNLGIGPLRFGDWGAASFSWEGSIYAMIGVLGELTDEDYDNVASYFASIAGTQTAISKNRLLFSHANEWRNEDSVPGFAPNAFAYSTLYYDTTATSVDVSYYCHGIISGYVSLVVYFDGGYYSQITPSGSGAATATVSLPPGSKRVGIVNSAMSGNAAGNYAIGTQVAGVTFNAAATKYAYPTAGRMLVYGDSVATGGHGSPLVQHAWPLLLRYQYGRDVAVYAESGRSFKTDYDNIWSVGSRGLFVDIVKGYAPAKLWFAMGVNDYGQAAWNAVVFGIAYAATLDALHAALPSLHIYAQSPLNPSYGATPNALGSTLQDYCDAIQAACVGRPWCTYVAGSSIITSPGTELTDGVHPNNAGNATYAAFVDALLP